MGKGKLKKKGKKKNECDIKISVKNAKSNSFSAHLKSIFDFYKTVLNYSKAFR